MFERHMLCHAALTAIYGVTGIVLVLEGAFAHAFRAFAAAIAYGVLIPSPAGRRLPDSNAMSADVTPHRGES